MHNIVHDAQCENPEIFSVYGLVFLFQIKSKELLFQFECDKKVHRALVEIKNLTSWTVLTKFKGVAVF